LDHEPTCLEKYRVNCESREASNLVELKEPQLVIELSGLARRIKNYAEVLSTSTKALSTVYLLEMLSKNPLRVL
jgi:hypothetical protein